MLIILIMLGPTTVMAAVQFPTNGNSGPLCGNHKCLGQGQAACVNGQCVCQGVANQGIGHFLCSRQDQNFAVVLNDPMVRGFDGTHIKISMVNKFLAAHISTKVCTGASPDNVVTGDGMCDIRLFPWGRRKRGKTFMRGIEMSVMVWVGNDSYHHTTRVEGGAFNGQYIYSEDGNTDPFGAGEFNDPVTTIIPGFGNIFTQYDSEDNFAVIRVDACGIQCGLRAVEAIGDPLLQPAGAYIKVLKACDPNFLSNDITVFSPPVGKGPSLQEQAQQISETIGMSVTPKLVAVFKALPGQHMQNFPNAPPEIGMLADTVQSCDHAILYRALTYCLFIIDGPRFFNCADKTDDGSVAIRMLDECIFSICDGNPFVCIDVQNNVIQSGCQSKLIPDQVSILDFDCNFLGP